MTEDVERLRSLLSACQRVLLHLEDRDDDVATSIRSTCRAIETRLGELTRASSSTQ